MITDEELEGMYLYWLDYYTSHGSYHYSDTSDERIREIYFDTIVDRVLSDLPEMDDEDTDAIINRLANF